MIAITRAVVNVVQEAVNFPSSLTDKEAVVAYITRLVPGIAEIITIVAGAIITGRLGLVGDGNPDLIRTEIAQELEDRGLTGLDPTLIEAIVTLVMAIIRALSTR